MMIFPATCQDMGRMLSLPPFSLSLSLTQIIDTSVVFPCAATYVSRAATRRLHAASMHEQSKRSVYGDCGPHKLVPFAVESFGALGPAASALLRECAELRQDRLGPGESEATWSTRSFSSYWRQRIAVGLQVDIGTGVESRALEDWEH